VQTRLPLRWRLRHSRQRLERLFHCHAFYNLQHTFSHTLLLFQTASHTVFPFFLSCYLSYHIQSISPISFLSSLNGCLQVSMRTIISFLPIILQSIMSSFPFLVVCTINSPAGIRSSWSFSVADGFIRKALPIPIPRQVLSRV
jgi:hypothetical protein